MEQSGSITGAAVLRDLPIRRVTLDVVAPPCATCVHEPVCGLRTAVEGLGGVETTAPVLPAGLMLSLAATVTCEHFLPDKSRPVPVRALTPQERGGQVTAASRTWNGGAFSRPKRVTSPETREKQRQGAIAAAARRRGEA